MMRGNRSAPAILALSLQEIIARRLQKALNSQESILFSPILPSDFGKFAENPPANENLPGSETRIYSQIRPKRIQSAGLLQYASAIALSLARPPLDAGSYAADLEHSLFQSIQSIPALSPDAQIWHRCRISVDSRGWIYVELSEIGTAIWLEALRSSALELDLHPNKAPVDQGDIACNTVLDRPSVLSLAQKQPAADLSPDHLLTVCYVHARCCSLLNRNSFDSSLSPPWLAEVELRCHHPVERQLIAEFCDVLDYLKLNDLNSSSGPSTALKIALRLSQALEAFGAACRLVWPDSAPNAIEPDLLAVRLGLIAIGQKLLQILLEQRLGLPAPTQL
jgi:hypothetical protein